VAHVRHAVAARASPGRAVLGDDVRLPFHRRGAAGKFCRYWWKKHQACPQGAPTWSSTSTSRSRSRRGTTGSRSSRTTA
jgi:hypothetical protein